MKSLASLAKVFAVVFSALFLVACSDSRDSDMVHRAVAIESGDECHLCGMLIGNFPGPKGEAYERGQTQVKKFCSTRDMFAFLLQPENTHRITQVFVHDMAVAPWESPDDEAFIDAKSAFYVVGHSQQGAMGPTLASFKSQADAEMFSREFGGRVIGFGEITMDLVVGLVSTEPALHTEASHHSNHSMH